jgi:hypothetical protein
VSYYPKPLATNLSEGKSLQGLAIEFMSFASKEGWLAFLFPAALLAISRTGVHFFLFSRIIDYYL